MRLTLSLACGAYEITRALLEGRVTPEGVDLISLPADTERTYRPDRRAECDIVEYNLFQFFADWSRDEDLVAIPVFPHRRFRLGSVFVPIGSTAQSVADLRHATVGIGGYKPAAAVWLRGITEEYYGIPRSEISWRDVFGELGEVPEHLPGALSASDASSRYEMDRCLESGRVDAVYSAYQPSGLAGPSPSVRRLYADPAHEEAEFYRQTGIFPAMHVVTLRRGLVDKHPWLPASVFRAFSQSKQIALHELRNPRALPLAFAQDAWHAQDELMGPDPWEFGLTAGNRTTLAAAVRYAVSEGCLPRPVDPTELFVPVDAEAPIGHEIR